MNIQILKILTFFCIFAILVLNIILLYKLDQKNAQQSSNLPINTSCVQGGPRSSCGAPDGSLRTCCSLETVQNGNKVKINSTCIDFKDGDPLCESDLNEC